MRKRPASEYAASKRYRTATRKPRASVTAVPRTARPRTLAVEVKDYIATPFSNETVGQGGNMSQNLTEVPVGASGQERTGRVILGKQMTWRCSIRYGGNTVGGEATGGFRLLFFRWDDDNQPSTGDILNQQGVNPIIAPYNLSNAFKLKVLYDRVYGLNTTQPSQGFTGAYAPGTMLLNGSFNCGWQMAYSTNDQSQDKGAIYCLCVCSQTNYASISLATQLMYCDI